MLSGEIETKPFCIIISGLISSISAHFQENLEINFFDTSDKEDKKAFKNRCLQKSGHFRA